MKKGLLTLTLLITIIYSKAQVIESIGYKGGISYATQKWLIIAIDIRDDKDYKIGAYNVLTANFFKSRFLFFSTDVGFIQKGCKDGGEKATYNYFTFSPKISVFHDFNKLSTYLFIGPRLDLQRSYKINYMSFSFEKEYEKTIWGLVYGAGMEYRIKRFGLTFEFSAYPDFTNLWRIDPSPIFNGIKISNEAYTISAGINYHFGM